MTPALPDGVVEARTFLQRLLGLWHPKARGHSVYFPNCRWVHGLGLRRPVLVWFYDSQGRPIASQVLRPWGWARCPRAHGCLEIRAQPTPRGAGLVEALIALPILLFLGLSVLQLGFLLEARLLAERAVDRGAQAGARSGGDANRIVGAMAQALAPVLLRPSSFASTAIEDRGGVEALAAKPKALLAFREQQLRLNLRWQLLGPTADDFADWASPTTGQLHPPRSLSHGPTAQPTGGAVGRVGPWPVGARSGRPEFEAKRLRLELAWAVPLRVPLAGPILGKALERWMHCAVAVASADCLALRHPQGPRLLLRTIGSAQLQAPLAPTP